VVVEVNPSPEKYVKGVFEFISPTTSGMWKAKVVVSDQLTLVCVDMLHWNNMVGTDSTNPGLWSLGLSSDIIVYQMDNCRSGAIRTDRDGVNFLGRKSYELLLGIPTTTLRLAVELLQATSKLIG
jgi:hypothetical protein